VQSGPPESQPNTQVAALQLSGYERVHKDPTVTEEVRKAGLPPGADERFRRKCPQGSSGASPSRDFRDFGLGAAKCGQTLAGPTCNEGF